MVNPIQNSNPMNNILPIDSFPGERLEKSQEIPRTVVDRKQETPSAREEIPREEVEKATDKLNRLMGIIDKRLQFSVHEASHRIMVKVIDQGTGDVLNEIPAKRVLDMLASFSKMVGMFVDKQV